jgi:hypothetical protein
LRLKGDLVSGVSGWLSFVGSPPKSFYVYPSLFRVCVSVYMLGSQKKVVCGCLCVCEENRLDEELSLTVVTCSSTFSRTAIIFGEEFYPFWRLL